MPALRMPSPAEAALAAGAGAVAALAAQAFARQRRAREYAMGVPPDQQTSAGGVRAFLIVFAVVLLAILTFRPRPPLPAMGALVGGGGGGGHPIGSGGDAMGDVLDLDALMQFADQRGPFF